MTGTLRSGLAGWLVVTVLLLSACATMDENQCLNADWYAIGVEDGARGRPLARLGDHRRACAKYGVAPQTERYLAGRNEGLESYCTYDRGYAMGRSGHGYADVCPGPLAANYSAGYRDGREYHDLTRRLKAVQDEIDKSKAALKAGIHNPRERAREVERLEALTREAEQLEQAIGRLPGR
jgi:hypothetical protein